MCAWLIALPGLLLTCLPALAQPTIGRGREADVLALVQPYQDEGPVTSGTTLAGISIAANQITLTIREGSGASAEVRLVPAADVPGRSFRIEAPPALTPALQQAQALLVRAVQAHDDGRFFAQAAAPPVTTQPSASTERVPGLIGLAAVLWAVLLVGLLAKIRRPPRSLPRILLAALVLVAAAGARHDAPLTPLHANDHAYEDLAVALSLPAAEPDAQRTMAEYGAAWTVAQRATVPLFGRTHDGVGRWAAAVGALAACLTFAAALAAGAGLFPALVGALLVALVPVAVRVGHSESTLVLAQALVAATLWLGTGTAALDRVAALAGLALLVLGHPLGLPLAGGTALLTWGLARPPSTPGSVETTGLVQVIRPALPGHVPMGARLKRWTVDLQVGWLALLVLAVGAAAVVALLGHAALLSRRLDATSQAVPMPGQPWLYWLWLDRQWAPFLLPWLALGGLPALYQLRRLQGHPGAALRTLGAAAGTAGVLLAGLVVIASVTDGLRYQAPFAPVAGVLVALAVAVLAGPGLPLAARWPLRAVALVPMVGIVLDRPGDDWLDSQGQTYAQIRRHLAAAQGDVWLVAPERRQARKVVVDVPSGVLARQGPTVHRLLAEDVLERCRKQSALPAPAWVVLPPACEAAELPGVPGACAILEPLADPRREASGVIQLSGRTIRQGIPEEFHVFPGGTSATWRISPLRCPPAGAGQAAPLPAEPSATGR